MPQEEINPLSFILFWPFYLFSFMVSALPTFPQFPTPTMSSSTPQSPKTSYSNVEEWTIREMPDGTVKMIIHRKAQRG